MPKLSTRLPAYILTGLTILASSTGVAQETRWFKVELLVFANQSPIPLAGAALAEQWNATPELVYPTASRFLVDAKQVALNNNRYDGKGQLDDYGRQIFRLTSEPGGFSDSRQGGSVSLPNAARNALTDSAANRTPRPLTPVFDETVPAAVAPVPAPVALVLPRPFVELPSAYKAFRGKAALMQRGGSYSVLFHEAWVQPVAAEGSNLPIVLDHSGDEQQWPRLQGTINIFLSRYLQLETNLWLNTAGDYLPGSWQMPAPPFGPPSLIVEQEDVIDIGFEVAEIQAGTASLTDPDTPIGASETISTSDGAAALDEVLSADASPLGVELATGADTEPMGPVYPYRHAVLLEQKRRMRSNEVHYVDHPLLGLIIKFTPVTAEQLDEIAAAQEKSLETGQSL